MQYDFTIEKIFYFEQHIIQKSTEYSSDYLFKFDPLQTLSNYQEFLDNYGLIISAIFLYIFYVFELDLCLDVKEFTSSFLNLFNFSPILNIFDDLDDSFKSSESEIDTSDELIDTFYKECNVINECESLKEDFPNIIFNDMQLTANNQNENNFDISKNTIINLVDIDLSIFYNPSLKLTKINKNDSTCGAYLVKDEKENNVGIFKPYDEECCDEDNKHLPVNTLSKYCRGIVVGDAYKKEIFAYLFDRSTFVAGVPLTTLSQFKTPPDNQLKHGSFQNFVENCGCSEDFNSDFYSIENVQTIAVLDICLCNLDRNSSNLLYTKTKLLVPIDHGLCLPDLMYIGRAYFEQLIFKQVKLPISNMLKSKIFSMNIQENVKILKQFNLPKGSILTYLFCSTFLKICVLKGCTLYQIGNQICRDIYSDLSKPSLIEEIVKTVLVKYPLKLNESLDYYIEDEYVFSLLTYFEYITQFYIL